MELAVLDSLSYLILNKTRSYTVYGKPTKSSLGPLRVQASHSASLMPKHLRNSIPEHFRVRIVTCPSFALRLHYEYDVKSLQTSLECFNY